MAARISAGLPRDHARLLPERDDAPRRSRHRTLGRFFQDEIATPLGLEFCIRLPEAIADSRLAPLHRPRRMAVMFLTMPLRLVVAAMTPRLRFRRALLGSELPEQSDRVYARNQEVRIRGKGARAARGDAP